MGVLEGAGVIYAVKPTYRGRRAVARVTGTNVGITHLGFSRGARTSRLEDVRLIGGMHRGLRLPVTVVLSAGNPRCHVGAFGGNGVFLGSNSGFAFATSRIRNSSRHISVGCGSLPHRLSRNSGVLLGGNLLDFAISDAASASMGYAILVNNRLSGHGDVDFPGGRLGRVCLDRRSGRSVLFNMGGSVSFVTYSFISYHRSLLSVGRFLERGGIRSVKLVTGVRGHSNISGVRRVYRRYSNVVITHNSVKIRVPFRRLPTVRGGLVAGYHLLNGRIVATARVLRSVVRGPHPAHTRVSSVTGTICSNADTVVLSNRATTNGCPILTIGAVTRVTRGARRGVRCRGHFLAHRFGVGGAISTVSRTAYNVTVSLRTGAVIMYSLSNSATHVISHFHPTIPVVNVAASRGA